SAVLVLLLVAGGVALRFDAQVRYLNGQLNASLADVEHQKGAAEAARAGEAEQRARAEDLLYFMRIERAQRAWQENDIPRMLEMLEHCDPERRQWEWHYLWRLCHSDLLTFKGHTDTVLSVFFSPDGR